MLRRILAVAVLLLAFTSSARADLDGTEGVWLGATYLKPIAPGSKWWFDTSAQVRLLNRPDVYNQFMLSLGMLYQINDNLRIGGGYRYLNDHYNVADPRNEQRSFQSMYLRFPFKDVVFNSVSLLEQRFREYETEMTLRFRQRNGFDIPLNKTLDLQIYDEYLISVIRPNWAGPSAFDQNRAYIGFRFPLSKETKLSIGYMNQFLIRNPNNIMNHIIIATVNF